MISSIHFMQPKVVFIWFNFIYFLFRDFYGKIKISFFIQQKWERILTVGLLWSVVCLHHSCGRNCVLTHHSTAASPNSGAKLVFKAVIPKPISGAWASWASTTCCELSLLASLLLCCRSYFSNQTGQILTRETSVAPQVFCRTWQGHSSADAPRLPATKAQVRSAT